MKTREVTTYQFTVSGTRELIRVLTSKYGCTVIEPPVLETRGRYAGMYRFTYKERE
jgi:hypothetical protein